MASVLSMIIGAIWNDLLFGKKWMEIVGSLERSLWIWAAFVVPTMAGAVMWTNETED